MMAIRAEPLAEPQQIINRARVHRRLKVPDAAPARGVHDCHALTISSGLLRKYAGVTLRVNDDTEGV